MFQFLLKHVLFFFILFFVCVCVCLCVIKWEKINLWYSLLENNHTSLISKTRTCRKHTQNAQNQKEKYIFCCKFIIWKLTALQQSIIMITWYTFAYLYYTLNLRSYQEGLKETGNVTDSQGLLYKTFFKLHTDILTFC